MPMLHNTGRYASSGATCQSGHVPVLKNPAGNDRSGYNAHRPPQPREYGRDCGRGAGAKDNRILPAGFAAERGRLLAPSGVERDSEFAPASDRIEYAVQAAAARAPFRVRVEALYQNLKPSHRAAIQDAEFHRRMAYRTRAVTGAAGSASRTLNVQRRSRHR